MDETVSLAQYARVMVESEKALDEALAGARRLLQGLDGATRGSREVGVLNLSGLAISGHFPARGEESRSVDVHDGDVHVDGEDGGGTVDRESSRDLATCLPSHGEHKDTGENSLATVNSGAGTNSTHRTEDEIANREVDRNRRRRRIHRG